MKIIEYTYHKYGDFNLYQSQEFLRYSDDFWQKLIEQVKEYPYHEIEENSIFIETSPNGGESFTIHEVKNENY